MKKKTLQKFKGILLEEKKRLISQALDATDEKNLVDISDRFDDLDLASSETNQTILHRIRDRERRLINKIDESLRRIEAGTYGVCEECGEDISEARLEARPVSVLCINCKEEQEKLEKAQVE